MDVSKDSAIRVIQNGAEYFFCSLHCKDKFIKESGMPDAEVCVPRNKSPFYKNKTLIVSAIPAILIFFSVFFAAFIPFRNIFLMYLKTIWWAVLLGLILGGIIDYYIPREYISKILSKKHPSTIFNAVLIGFLMSACSHGILALSIQIHKKGASNPAVVSFLLASPWANLTITVMLVAFFGLKGLFIVIAAIVIAINTGFIFMFLEKKGLIEKNKFTVPVAEDFSILKDWKERLKTYKFGINSFVNDIKGVLKGTAALSDMVLWWIILGIFISSLAGAYIPVHFFHKFMGPTFMGLIITLFIATIIEVCSEGSSPLSFEIYRQTGAMGNSFVFLMAGVVTDYTEIGLLWANVGRRVALWLPAVAVPQVILVGYIANKIFK